MNQNLSKQLTIDIIDDFVTKKERKAVLNYYFLKIFLTVFEINFNSIKKKEISIYFITQSLYVILSYNHILDLDAGPEKNRALGLAYP